jgi:hypothetical protein
MAATRERPDPDVQRLEAERLRPTTERQGTPEELIRELVHILACALGIGRRL